MSVKLSKIQFPPIKLDVHELNINISANQDNKDVQEFEDEVDLLNLPIPDFKNQMDLFE